MKLSEQSITLDSLLRTHEILRKEYLDALAGGDVAYVSSLSDEAVILEKKIDAVVTVLQLYMTEAEYEVWLRNNA